MRTSELLERIRGEESELRMDAFGFDDAWALGCEMRSAATAAGLPIVIGIVLGEQRVFHSALPGSSADNDGWLERKMAVVRRYGHSSLLVGEQFRAEGKDFDVAARLDPRKFAAHGGVFPLILRRGGAMLGAVGVSGLPQRDDHDFVVEQLRAFLAGRP